MAEQTEMTDLPRYFQIFSLTEDIERSNFN